MHSNELCLFSLGVQTLKYKVTRWYLMEGEWEKASPSSGDHWVAGEWAYACARKTEAEVYYARKWQVSFKQ